MRSPAVSHASDRAKTAQVCIVRPLDAFCGFQQPNARPELRLEAVSSRPWLGVGQAEESHTYGSPWPSARRPLGAAVQQLR
jgi:hypothetical protein